MRQTLVVSNVPALDAAGALQQGLWVEIVLVVLCGTGWWFAGRNRR